MAKILLVEDDQNLSEIYSARLGAEGYEIVSAANGEDALAIAAREKPDLVISDVMMPRVSGFEMLDILKHTDGTVNAKTIMLTALGQDSDRAKASELGADKYLVKSQVTLEDIVNTAKELLGDAEEPAPVQLPEPAIASTQPIAGQPVPAAPQAASPAPMSTPLSTPATNTDASSFAAPVQSVPTSEPASLAAGQNPIATTISEPEEPVNQLSPPVNDVTTPPVSSQAPVADNTQTNQAAPAPTTPTFVPEPAVLEATKTEDNPGTSQAATESGAVASDTGEPIAEEEAELQQQLSDDASLAQADAATDPSEYQTTSPTPSQSPNHQAEEATVASPTITPEPASAPLAPQPVQSTFPTEPSQPPAESVTPQAQPPIGQPVEQAPQAQPAAPPPEQQLNHDEVLAAALKELEGETQPGQAGANAAESDDANNNAISGRKVIQPIGDQNPKPDINQLLNEEAKTEASSSPSGPAPESTGNDQPTASDDLNNIAL